jgi:hypothetical protein
MKSDGIAFDVRTALWVGCAKKIRGPDFTAVKDCGGPDVPSNGKTGTGVAD